MTVMKEGDRTFTLDELGGLVDLPRRTVRYYIQIGLVDRPEGAGRGARYTAQHLDQLLEIRKWQQAGLSLERIRELLGTDAEASATPPLPPRQRGAVEVWSHIVINDGVELTLDPRRANLSPEEVRELATGLMDLYEGIRSKKE
jgi:DNA-binding transcriptional MerR regulator